MSSYKLNSDDTGKLYQVMGELGMDQAYVSGALNTTRATISRYLSGDRGIPPYMALQLYALLREDPRLEFLKNYIERERISRGIGDLILPLTRLLLNSEGEERKRLERYLERILRKYK